MPLPIPRPSLPIGDDRALVRLETGEYVCVDLRSLDALAYLLGWDLESGVQEVFRSFLTPRSVVLDIGASFGLYTAIAANAVRRDGRLYAFEGNPLVFRALERTIIANGVYGQPNVVAANVLVSECCGQGRLFFPAEGFHLGTMSERAGDAGERHSVEVTMTTIDAFLPLDIAVDLAKIDVEGHEPLVLRGMERTIARSPNLRLIIEFVDTMLAETVPAPEFADYIRRLGFAICRILPEGDVEAVESGEPIGGFNMLLLTRAPEADMAAIRRRRRSLRRRLTGWASARRVRRGGTGWPRW